MQTHRGRGSLRSTARTSASAPSDILPSPVAARPYPVCPLNTRRSRSSAVGQPFACSRRLGRTCPYAWIRARMVSGWTAVLCQVDVEALSPSISISFEYRRRRTSDIWSSGSLPMSEITMTRGYPLNSSTCAGGSGCPASAAAIHKTRTNLINPLYAEGGASCHRQNDFPDVRAALHVAVRGGGLGEREDAIHQHLHRPRFQQRPDAGAQFRRDLAFLGDGARAHGGPGHREALLHDLRQINRSLGALLDGDLYEASTRGKHLQIARRVRCAHHVEHQIDVTKLLGEIEFPVIDGPLRPELHADAALLFTACRGEYRGAKRAGELDGGGADAAGTAVHQHALAGRQVSDLEDVGPDGEKGLRDAGGLLHGDALRHRQTLHAGHQAVLGVAAAGRERADAVPFLPIGVRGRGGDGTRDFQSEDRRRARRRRILAGALQHVRTIDPRRLDTNQHFTGPWHGHRTLDEMENVRRTGLCEGDVVHRCIVVR